MSAVGSRWAIGVLASCMLVPACTTSGGNTIRGRDDDSGVVRLSPSSFGLLVDPCTRFAVSVVELAIYDNDTLSEMVVSCIVPVDGVTLDEAAIIAFLKEQLASYKLPRKILLFSEEDFALTGNEKAKTGEIRAQACKRLGVEV